MVGTFRNLIRKLEVEHDDNLTFTEQLLTVCTAIVLSVASFELTLSFLNDADRWAQNRMMTFDLFRLRSELGQHGTSSHCELGSSVCRD